MIILSINQFYVIGDNRPNHRALISIIESKNNKTKKVTHSLNLSLTLDGTNRNLYVPRGIVKIINKMKIQGKIDVDGKNKICTCSNFITINRGEEISHLSRTLLEFYLADNNEENIGNNATHLRLANFRL